MFEAARSGATDPQITGRRGRRCGPRSAATAVDVLDADGYLLGTPANLGYISGALKHFFDQIYYPCLDATIGRPFGLYVHGNNDTDGAVQAVEMITTGLQLASRAAPGLGHRRAAPGRPRRVLGARRQPQRADGRGTRLNHGRPAVSQAQRPARRRPGRRWTTARHTAGPSSAGTLHVERPRTSTTPSSSLGTSSKSLR